MNHPTAQTEGLTYERYGELYAQQAPQTRPLRDIFPTVDGHRTTTGELEAIRAGLWNEGYQEGLKEGHRRWASTNGWSRAGWRSFFGRS